METLDEAIDVMRKQGANLFVGTTDNCEIIECYIDEQWIGHIHKSYNNKFKPIYVVRFNNEFEQK